MNKQSIREALDEFAEQELPQDPDLWPFIRQRVVAGPPMPSIEVVNTELDASARVQKHTSYVLANGLASMPALKSRNSHLRNLSVATLLVLAMATVGVLLVVVLNRGAAGIDPLLNAATAQGTHAPITSVVNGYRITLTQSYASDGRMQIIYSVLSPERQNLSLYRLYQNGMHVYYADDIYGSKGLPKLTDETGANYSYLDVSFSWSAPTRVEEKTPVNDIESHQGAGACCLGTADQIILYFAPSAQSTQKTQHSMHLSFSVFLPEDVLTPVPQVGNIAPAPATLTPLGYQAIVDARIDLDFTLVPPPGS